MMRYDSWGDVNLNYNYTSKLKITGTLPTQINLSGVNEPKFYVKTRVDTRQLQGANMRASAGVVLLFHDKKVFSPKTNHAVFGINSTTVARWKFLVLKTIWHAEELLGTEPE